MKTEIIWGKNHSDTNWLGGGGMMEVDCFADAEEV